MRSRIPAIVSGGILETLHPSAVRPVSASPFGPYVPSQMGMCLAALGSIRAPSVWKCRPRYENAGCDQTPRMI